MKEFSLSSPAFANGAMIPQKYGYKHGNVSPPLVIQGVPDNCTSLALIMDDPDAVGAVGRVWVHWLLWNIPSHTTKIQESQIPSNSLEGTTDFNEIGYGGPAPPDKQHTYIFNMYALDSVLSIREGATKNQLKEAMKNHIISKASLTGTFAP